MPVNYSNRDLRQAGDHELIASIRQHMFTSSGAPCTLQQLAKITGVSSRHISMAVRRGLGMTFVEFIRSERMLLGQRLLLQTSLPVQDIALRLGFVSPTNFSSVFREYTGMSPSQFREQSPLTALAMTENSLKWGGA